MKNLPIKKKISSLEETNWPRKVQKFEQICEFIKKINCQLKHITNQKKYMLDKNLQIQKVYLIDPYIKT